MSSNTYPKKLKLFKAWAKAMEQGATVGEPSYTQTHARRKPLRRAALRRRRRSKKKKKD